jgi:carbon storage regulator
MLILGRHPGESILVGQGIRIVVLSCDRRGVRLGIEAPSDVSIVREEIVVAIADENHRASEAPTDPDWIGALAIAPVTPIVAPVAPVATPASSASPTNAPVATPATLAPRRP